MKRNIKDDAYNQLGRKDPKRVAIYIRVSHDEQVKHGLSLESQKKTLEEYCKKHGHIIVGTYVDEGLTARKTLRKRVQFNKMINDVKQDKIDLIIFIKLDRWFRNVRDYYNTMDVLEAHNCTWIATEEDYDLTTSTGRLNLNIRLSISQNESDQTSDRIHFVFDNRRAEGYVVTGSCPFGYKIVDKKYVPDEEKVKILNDIYDYYLKTGGARKTLLYYRENYGNLCYDTIRRYLSNPAYIGKYTTEKGEVIENYTPPIIDEDKFNRVQQLLSKNIRDNGNTKKDIDFIFDGLFYCTRCGARFTRNYKPEKKAKSQYYEYYYYKCHKAYKMDCDNKRSVNEEQIEKLLLSKIKEEANKYISENKIKGSKGAKIPKDNTPKIKDKLKKLRELYIEGDIEKTEYLDRKEKLEKELAENIALLQHEDTPRDTRHLEKLINSDFETVYHTLTRENKRRFWASFIDKIYVDNREITKIIFL